MGAIADATSTRWGRFRPWLLAICVPFAVSCVLVYSVPSFGDTGNIYAVAAYIFMTLMYTAINIPYCSLGRHWPPIRVKAFLCSPAFCNYVIGGALGTALILPLSISSTLLDTELLVFRWLWLSSAVLAAWCLSSVSSPPKNASSPSKRTLILRATWKFCSKMTSGWSSVYNFMMLVAVVLRGGAVVYYINIVLNKGADIITLFMLGGMFLDGRLVRLFWYAFL